MKLDKKTEDVIIDNKKCKLLELHNENLLYRRYTDSRNKVKKIELESIDKDSIFLKRYLLIMSNNELTIGYTTNEKFFDRGKNGGCENYFSYKIINNKIYLDVFTKDSNEVEIISVRPEMEYDETDYTYSQLKTVDGVNPKYAYIPANQILLNKNATQNLVDTTVINENIIDMVTDLSAHFQDIFFDLITDDMLQTKIIREFNNLKSKKMKVLEK